MRSVRRHAQWFLSGAAMLVALEAIASAAPSDGYNVIEAGVSAGAFFPSRDHALFDPVNNDPAALKTGLDLQLHLAYFPFRYLGAEIEGGFVPIKTVNDGSAQIFLGRGHLVAQLPWRLTPFLVAGGGFIGLSSGRDVMGSDLDTEIHWGGGIKLYATDTVSLRIDARDLVTAKADETSMTHHFEVFAGVTIALWRSKDEIEPPIEFPVVERKYPAPPPGLPLPDPNVEVKPIEIERPLDCTKAAGNPLCTPEETIKAELDRVHFGWGSWRLHPQETSAIDNAAQILREHPELSVEIDGHADATGPETFNGWLSVKRAKVVMEYLIHVGIDACRLSVQGFGSSKPAEPNKTEEGRAANRRSEIRVLRELKPATDQAAAPRP